MCSNEFHDTGTDDQSVSRTDDLLRILGLSSEEGMQVVNAEVPMAEMAKYATDIRSMTGGRGSFEMEFARYEQVPGNVASEIIAKHQAEKQAEE